MSRCPGMQKCHPRPTKSRVGLLVTTAAPKATPKATTSESRRVELLEEQMNARTKERGSVLTYKCIDERILSSFFKERTLKNGRKLEQMPLQSSIFDRYDGCRH